MKAKGVIVIDVQKCRGCKSCEVECAIAHSHSKRLIDSLKEKNMPSSRIKVESIEGVSVPIRCAHCKDAPCIDICPRKAISRKGEGGPVVIEQDRCAGCRFCIIVCPYGIPEQGDDRKVIKCDLCFERLQKGEKPACVVACPTGAITFVETS